MVKKFFMMALLLAVFVALPFTSVTSASVAEFDGEIYCDLDGLYYLGPIAYPLNVLGLLDVSEGGLLLGTLSINAQKTSIHEDWDETYIGHWAFYPEDSESGYELGIISSLSGCDLEMLSFTLDGSSEVLGLEGDQMVVCGSMYGNTFSGSMVPIPGALLLFGSGLLSLICIRRK